MRKIFQPTFTATSIETLDPDLLKLHLKQMEVAPQLATFDADDTLLDHHELTVRPAALGVMRALRSSGIQHFAVISNAGSDKRRARVRQVVHDLERAIEQPVPLYISGIDGRPKPSTQLFKRAAKEAGVTARQAMHFGDLLLKDIWAPNMAGYGATVWLTQPLTADKISNWREREVTWQTRRLAGFTDVISLDKPAVSSVQGLSSQRPTAKH